MRKWMDKIVGVVNIFAIASLLILMVLTTVDVLMRYIINKPITGAFEISGEYLMPILVFFAVAFAYGRGAMIRIELVTERVPAAVRKVFNYFSQIVSALGTLCLLAANVMQVQRVYAMHSISAGSLRYPLWPAYVILVVGLTLLFIYMCMDISRVKTEESSLFAKPDEEEKVV